jgi:hypothetical protein
MQVAGILCSLAKACACVKHGSIHIKIKFLWILSGYMVSSVYANVQKQVNLILRSNKTNLVQLHINTMWSECTIWWQNEVTTTQFIGQQVGCKLKWKIHIKYINPKLSSACYVMITLPAKIEI